MARKQVFETYDRTAAPTAEDYRYCPRCGGGLSPRAGDGRPSCPACGFVRFRNPLPGVAVLIVDGERVLLGRRAAGNYGAARWCLPGGFIEYDEDFHTAAIREVREETGLEVEITSILNVASNFLSPRLHTLVVALLARPVSVELMAGDDAREVAWFSLHRPLPEMAFEADRYIIEAYARSPLQGLEVDPPYASGGRDIG